MYGKSEVEHRCSHREPVEVAHRSEDEHLFVIQVHLEIFHELHGAVGGLKDVTNIVHPCVQLALALYALVFPVGCETFFCNEVHPASAYLDFDPFAVRSHDGGVERLVSIAFRD